jgi:hypothetical protein
MIDSKLSLLVVSKQSQNLGTRGVRALWITQTNGIWIKNSHTHAIRRLLVLLVAVVSATRTRDPRSKERQDSTNQETAKKERRGKEKGCTPLQNVGSDLRRSALNAFIELATGGGAGAFAAIFAARSIAALFWRGTIAGAAALLVRGAFAFVGASPSPSDTSEVCDGVRDMLARGTTSALPALPRDGARRADMDAFARYALGPVDAGACTDA